MADQNGDSYTGGPSKNKGKYPRGKYIIVTNHAEVAHLTASGGHLVDVLPVQIPVVPVRDQACPRCGTPMWMTQGNQSFMMQCNSCRISGVVAINEMQLANGHAFLILVEVDQVYEGLQQQITRLQERSYTRMKEMEALMKEKEELEKINVRLDELEHKASGKIEELQKALEAARNDLKGSRVS